MGFKIDDDRENEIDNDYKRHYNYTTILNIPDNYSLDYVPENVSFSTDYFTFHIEYKQERKRLIYNQFLEFNFLKLDLAAQKELNDIIKKVEKSYNEIIVLKKQ